ncbi:unnamed protein product [Polarella glacialis]|uniref:Uncharacterized protein n=1 Tax=Polarella glacialis TaxID=89957 RepID=A0A813FUZ3_POLGL|nr:unnamed protein product [Polarella glacialis]
MQRLDTYYMCVGGLSGFDGIVALRKAGASLRRVVLYDRDDDALVHGQLMLALIQTCPTRAKLLRAVFGRCPEAWQREQGCPLTADSMFNFLRSQEIDIEFVLQTRRSLPRPLRPHFDVLVQAAAYGCDPDEDCSGVLPRRRLWPCWGLGRRCPPIEVGLHGGGDETFNYGEAGWLADDASYVLLRSVVAPLSSESSDPLQSPQVSAPHQMALDTECQTAVEVSFRKLDLNDMQLDAVSSGCDGHVLFISNADENPKFLRSRDALECQLFESECGRVLVASALRITIVRGRGRLRRILAERSRHDSSRHGTGLQPASESNDAQSLRLLRRHELLEHLKRTAADSVQAARRWPCSTMEKHFWRMTRLLAVLQDDT